MNKTISTNEELTKLANTMRNVDDISQKVALQHEVSLNEFKTEILMEWDKALDGNGAEVLANIKVPTTNEEGLPDGQVLTVVMASASGNLPKEDETTLRKSLGSSFSKLFKDVKTFDKVVDPTDVLKSLADMAEGLDPKVAAKIIKVKNGKLTITLDTPESFSEINGVTRGTGAKAKSKVIERVGELPADLRAKVRDDLSKWLRNDGGMNARLKCGNRA